MVYFISPVSGQLFKGRQHVSIISTFRIPRTKPNSWQLPHNRLKGLAKRGPAGDSLERLGRPLETAAHPASRPCWQCVLLPCLLLTWALQQRETQLCSEQTAGLQLTFWATCQPFSSPILDPGFSRTADPGGTGPVSCSFSQIHTRSLGRQKKQIENSIGNKLEKVKAWPFLFSTSVLVVIFAC